MNRAQIIFEVILILIIFSILKNIYILGIKFGEESLQKYFKNSSKRENQSINQRRLN